ncbi:MAG: hypothetical protein DHS80DRAFT_22846 [Piptocephalis tieghemiana]|nr:MAG: hypothetical protein DHS80DRAFT_22846 [Piptocephalis tieghemiana]
MDISLPLANSLRQIAALYTSILLFFLFSFRCLAPLARKLPSPIHYLALSQAFLGILVQGLNLLYALNILLCPTFAIINLFGVALGCLAINSIMILKVIYLRSYTRLSLMFLLAYILLYSFVTIFIYLYFEPIFDGHTCYTPFGPTLSILKLVFDLIVNTALGLLVIHSVRALAIADGTSYWHHIILSEVYYVLLVFVVNLVSAIISGTNALGVHSFKAYYIDWLLVNLIVTMQLLSADRRRERRRHGSLMDMEDSIMNHSQDHIMEMTPQSPHNPVHHTHGYAGVFGSGYLGEVLGLPCSFPSPSPSLSLSPVDSAVPERVSSM